MRTTGSERRARRQRSKPYERPPPKQSSLSSIWSVLTAPFKRASSPTDADEDAASYSGSDASESEEELQKRTRRIREPYVPSAGAIRLSKRGEEMHDRNYQSSGSTLPASQVSATTVDSVPSASTVFTNSSGLSSTTLGQSQTRCTGPTSIPKRHQAQSRSCSPENESASASLNRYQPIVDFLQSKGDAKLNEFELLGVAQSLKDSSDTPPEDLLSLMKSAMPPADVPSAALLTLRSSRSSTPAVSKPFLSPVSKVQLNLPNMPAPTRKHRRRSTYVGVGQTTPRRYGTPSRSRANVGAADGGEIIGPKKRRIGDFGAPGASEDKTSLIPPGADKLNTMDEGVFPSGSNTVPFPSSSPAKFGEPSRTSIEQGQAQRLLPRNTAFFGPSSPVSIPLRKLPDESDPSSRPSKLGSKIRSQKAEPKSQASVAILDILKDGTGSPELPDPNKSANDVQSPLFNPFQTVATPGRVRVSTPTPRKPLKRASPAVIGAPASAKHDSSALQTDNILDQIVSTVPKQPPSKRAKGGPGSNGDLVTAPPINVFHSRTEVNPLFLKHDWSKTPNGKPVGPITTSEPSDQNKRVEKLGAAGHPSTFMSSEPEVIEIDDGDENAKNGDVKIPEDAEMEDGDSRPLRSPSLSPSKATHLQPSSVEEADDSRAFTTGVQPSSRLANKHRPAPLAPRPGNSSNGLLPPGAAFKSTSPVIPSPLRHVSLPPEDDDDEETPNTAPERQQAPATADTAMKGTQDSAALPSSPKSQALRIPLQELTAFEILLPTSIAAIQTMCKSRESSEALQKATTLPEADLPKYDFSGSGLNCKNPPIPIIKTTSASPSASPPPVRFDYAAAGFKIRSTPAGTWTCSVCACQSPLSAAKCTVCESPKPEGTPSITSPSLPIQPDKSKDTKVTNGTANTPRGGFDWAAAGMAKPAVRSNVWTCSTCGIQNGLDKQTCMACEAASPESSQPVSPKTLVASFDWAAAGLKPKDSRNTWTCGTCMVTNDQDKAKCIACEESRP